MEYVIAILIVLLYFKHYFVDNDLPKKEIDAYLMKNNLSYLNHEKIKPDADIKSKFYLDANPFLFLFYGIEYYTLIANSLNGENITIYVKRYKQRALFNKSKLYYVRDNS